MSFTHNNLSFANTRLANITLTCEGRLRVIEGHDILSGRRKAYVLTLVFLGVE